MMEFDSSVNCQVCRSRVEEGGREEREEMEV